MNRLISVPTLAASSVVLVAVEGSARAQAVVDWDVSATATLGVTDNIAGTPESDNPDQQPAADGYGTISPAARLQFETKRATQTLSYGFAYNYFFTHPEANSFSNSLSYGLTAPVGPGTDYFFSLGGSQSTTSTFNLLATAGGNQAQPNQGGNNILVSAGGGMGYSTELSQTVRLGQAIAGTYSHTIIEPTEEGGVDPRDQRTAIGSLSTSVTKSWSVDTLTFEQGNDVQYTPLSQAEVVIDGEAVLVDVPRTLQILNRARLNWGHQFSPEWSSQLGAGIVVGYEALAGGSPVPHPTGLASLSYAPPGGSLVISYAHDAQPNVLLRQLTVADTASVAGNKLLPRRFDVGGTQSVVVTQSLLGSDPAAGDTVSSPGIAILTDLALGWIPAYPVRLELRYQFMRQFAASSDQDAPLFPTVQRHTGLFSIQFQWPGAPTAGGATGGFVLPPASASVEVLSTQAPRSERAVDEEEKKDKNGDGFDDKTGQDRE